MLSRMSLRTLLLIIGMSGLAACGDDGEPVGTANPPPGGGGHEHIYIGSTEPGGGALLGDFDFEHKVATASFTECLGGSGDQCVGGVAIYTATAPAFALITPSREEPGKHVLADDTPISLELTAIDSAVRVRVAERFMSQPGESDLIGITPFHSHGEFQVAVPGPSEHHHARDHDGEEENEHHVSFRFTSSAPALAPSESYTLRIVTSDEEHGHDHD
jgi:hypothetical protein